MLPKVPEVRTQSQVWITPKPQLCSMPCTFKLLYKELATKQFARSKGEQKASIWDSKTCSLLSPTSPRQAQVLPSRSAGSREGVQQLFPARFRQKETQRGTVLWRFQRFFCPLVAQGHYYILKPHEKANIPYKGNWQSHGTAGGSWDGL